MGQTKKKYWWRGAKSPRQDGETNTSAKLTADDVRVIRTRIAAKHTDTAIAADYGVSRGTIGLIRNGIRWKTVT